MADSSITNLPNAVTTPADDDKFAVDDASASDQTKRVTWANVKTTLNTYFATLFLGITQSQNAQVGTTYTLVLTDANKLVTLTNASAITMTVPPNSSVAFPTGTQIDLAQRGAGAVTVAQGSGVTVNVHADDTRVLDGQYSYATLVKVGTNTWDLFGNLVAA